MKAKILIVFATLLMFVLLAFAFVFAILYVINAPGTQIRPDYQDVPYVSGSSPSQKLDIYLPKNAQTPYPVVIWVHGGGWSGGDKADEGTGYMAKLLLDRGYAVVSINYRLSGEATFPAQIYDVKAAIRWVRAHDGDYGIDADRIGLWGGSAGGHLVALAGTSGDVAELEDLSMGNANESSRVQAVVDWSGPTDFSMIEQQASEGGITLSPITMTCVAGFIGGNLSDHQDVVKAVNPETYISADDPPFLIEHGTRDELVPVQQSVAFSDKLRAAVGQDNVTLLVFESAGHGDEPFIRQFAGNLTMLYDFLDHELKH